MKKIWMLDNNTPNGDIFKYQTIIEPFKENSEYIAFHELSQWIIYSIIDINKKYKIFNLIDINILTPISWYNLYNLLDYYNVLLDNTKKKYNVSSLKVIETRALTIIIYKKIYIELNKNDTYSISEFIENGPLAILKNLEIKESSLNIINDGIYF